jgi:hypothetical protein
MQGGETAGLRVAEKSDGADGRRRKGSGAHGGSERRSTSDLEYDPGQRQAHAHPSERNGAKASEASQAARLRVACQP